jgi:hypothetical protein
MLCASPARAQDTRQASQHFQRAVALYGEADYRAALVEFKRAYALAPNPAVLYNVGETQYQLQDYAGALATFERFLAEAPAGDGHRAEVDGNLEVLRARVGHVSVTTTPAGADVTVDDQPAGKTPFDRPLVLTIGRRKLVATLPGRPPVTRYVELAADDNLSVTIDLPEPAPAPAPSRSVPAWHPVETPAPSRGGDALRIAGWIATGTFTAGAVCFGILGMHESHDLESERGTFPASAQTLSNDASLVTTYSIVADGLAVGALVVGGVTLLSTILSGSTRPPARGSSSGPQVVLGPGAARVVFTF